MAKDYYLILGVGCDATLEQIKSAYRREAKRCHPDLSGQDSEPFLIVREAYEVLADPKRRRDYDDELARKARVQHPARPARTEPLRPRRCPVEPLVPARHPGDSRSGFWESLSPFATARPRAAQASYEIHVEVRVTREQSRYGGRFRIWLPVQIRCPACRGWGDVGFFECQACLGRGTVDDEYPITVTFPAGLVDGCTERVSLSSAGLIGATLVLHFRAAEQL